MKNFKKVALAAACTAMLGGVSGVVTTANAANWLMLQGTENRVFPVELNYGGLFSQHIYQLAILNYQRVHLQVKIHNLMYTNQT